MPIIKKSLSVELRNAIGSSSSQRKLVTSPRLLSDWRAVHSLEETDLRFFTMQG